MSTQSGVYIKDKEYGWLPANVISYDGNDEEGAGQKVQVSVSVPQGDDSTNAAVNNSAAKKETRTIQLKEYDDGMLPLQNIDEGGNMIVVPDMCDLPSLHEAAILYNLKARHESCQPYTRVGDIVIAMNPFHWIDGIYSPEIRELYVNTLIRRSGAGVANANGVANGGGGSDNGNIMSSLDPHVYEVSSLAYRGLAMDGQQNQSILVSGESGAGKTETVKIVMSHLASVQINDETMDVDVDVDVDGNNVGANNVSANNTDNNSSNNVVKRVLDSNPLLEAFGNAKTIRNDNSSRFGKYIQLQFDVEDATAAAYKGKALPSCVLAGSISETYLLEKSRVVSHDELHERTYHIFYQLLSAPESMKCKIWDGLSKKDFASFKYVGDTDTVLIEHKTDGQKWQTTVDALSLIGIPQDSSLFIDLMRAICITMQLGNLTFGIDPSNADDGSIITSKDELVKLSNLMGVNEEDIQKALTYRTVYAPKESYSVPLRASTAKDGCDAFAKEIYHQVFDWLVMSINEATCAEKNYEYASTVEEDGYGLIGLLDIFGFESFKVNRFEQLCINYANEKLQSKYNLDIFSSVQDEYEYEGIAMPDVSFTDNSDVVNLIEGRMGLISMLNEECLRPHGNDSSFVSKMKKVNNDFDALVKNPLHTPTQFAIQHYASEVLYEATNFVQKNTDTLPNDLIECASKSTNALLRSNVAKENGSGGEGGPSTTTTVVAKSRKKLSVSSKFRSQLSSLMVNISATRSRYIRCIKPNPEKVPRKTDLSSSLEQLRCAGVVAAVTISRVSYPNRLTHDVAIDRFSCLLEDTIKPDIVDSKQLVTVMMEHLLGNFKVDTNSNSNSNDSVNNPFETGKSRIYYKAGALEHLESRRLAKLGILATAIQKTVRGFVAFAQYTRLYRTSIAVQALVRRNIARMNLLRACSAVTTISCWVRCVFAKAELLRLRREKASTLLQTRFRIFTAQRVLSRSLRAAIFVQKVWRGALQRPLYQKLLEEAKEEARVNTKLAALQKRLADAEMKWIMADKARMEAEKRAAAGGPPAEVVDEKKEEEQSTSEMSEDQKSLLDESTKMLEFLRKQVFEFRSKNFLLRNDLKELKIAHHHLVEQYSGLNSSYGALKQHSSNLSQSNKKMVVQATAAKKDLYETKKELKISLFHHKAEMRKMSDLMRAKDKDNAETISRMQAEIAALRAIKDKETMRSKKRNQTPPNTSLSNSLALRNRQEQAKKASTHKHSQSLRSTEKKRASFSGRNRPSSSKGPDGDVWGHDGFFSMHGSSLPKSSPPSSESSFSSGKKNQRQRPPRTKNSFVKDSKKSTNNSNSRVVSPDQNQRLTSSNHSTSSLKEALNKKSTNNDGNKRSSLAAAVSKKSSLASKAKEKANK